MLLLGKERWRDSWFSMDLLAVGTHSFKPIFICIYWYKKFISIAILFVSSLPKLQRKKNFSILQINLPTIQWKSIIPPSDLLLLNDDLRAPFSSQTKAFRLANLPTSYFPTINFFPKSLSWIFTSHPHFALHNHNLFNMKWTVASQETHLPPLT